MYARKLPGYARSPIRRSRENHARREEFFQEILNVLKTSILIRARGRIVDLCFEYFMISMTGHHHWRLLRVSSPLNFKLFKSQTSIHVGRHLRWAYFVGLSYSTLSRSYVRASGPVNIKIAPGRWTRRPLFFSFHTVERATTDNFASNDLKWDSRPSHDRRHSHRLCRLPIFRWLPLFRYFS